jgi:subtilase family serine protease
MKKHLISLAAISLLLIGSASFAQISSKLKPKLVDISMESVNAVKIGENDNAVHVRITFTVKNNSAVSTSVGMRTLTRYFEVMLTRLWDFKQPPAFLGMFKISHLTPGESKTVTHEEWIVKSIHMCTYTAKADPSNWIDETNESNNEKVFLFRN